ncbi:MAG: MmgE/PrpD family protein, partial [Rhodospirillales bacterium]|nr:MmgE/PrpD family protein [Rhodospirillales bacterium]
PGNYDAARLFKTWGAPLDIIDPGIAFKQYPCCASTHSAIDAILTICREHGLKGDQIASITSWTHPRRLRHTNRPNPKSGLDAKFSVQYCLARAALDGNVRLNHFEDVVINDPGVREMMSRITAEPHPESKMDTSEHFFADVTVKTREGESFRAFVDRPAGRDRDHPLPEGTLERKFEDCASKKLDAGAVEAVRKSILDLESASRISDISELILQGTSVFEDVAMNGQGETRAAHVVAG